MTATKLTRRTVLSASVAAVATGAPVAALATTNSPDAALLALESRWRTAVAEKNRTRDAWRAIHDALPEHARGGVPKVPTDGAAGLFPRSFRGRAIDLRNLRGFNLRTALDEAQLWGDSPARLARVRAEGRERIRWWISICRDGRRLRAASGLDEADERDEAAYEVLSAIEDEIMATAPEGVEGLRIKLAVLARMAFIQHSDDRDNAEPAEEWEYTDRAVYDLHAQAERIAGRVQA
jgi:hypothetical protein